MSPRVVSLKPGHRAALQRDHRYRSETSVLLAAAAEALHTLAGALEDDATEIGMMAGQAVYETLAPLPLNVREALRDCLSDEAAQGYRAARLYALEDSTPVREAG